MRHGGRGRGIGGGIEQPLATDLSCQFQNAGAETAAARHRRLAKRGGSADLTRQIRDRHVDLHLQCIFHLPPGQTARDADAVQHHHRALALHDALPATHSSRSVSRTAASVGSITSTR